MIALSEPKFQENEKKYLLECLKTNWVSTSGPFVKKFENEIKKITKAKYVVACQSATSALYLSLKILGVTKNDEVLVPSITYIAPVNAICHNQANPVFMDCDEWNNLDIQKTLLFIKKNTFTKKNKLFNKRTKKQIKALIIPHLLGSAVFFDKLKKICKKNAIFIVEDAAESFGVFFKNKPFKNKHTGLLGDIGCLSFNTNKIVTSACGGALITNTKSIAKKFQYLIHQAKDDSDYFIHNDIGYNLGLSNLHAALGFAQIKNIKLFKKKKKNIFFQYKKNIKKTSFFELVEKKDYVDSNYWLIIIKTKKRFNIKKLVLYLKKNNVQSRMLWYPNHLQKPFFKYEKTDLSQSMINYKTHLCLPSSSFLTKKEIKKVCDLIIKFEKKYLLK